MIIVVKYQYLVLFRTKYVPKFSKSTHTFVKQKIAVKIRTQAVVELVRLGNSRYNLYVTLPH